MPLGIPELLVILVIVLLIFGPKRLPSLGRQLGAGMREFKDSITSKHDADDDEQAVAATSPAAAATPELAPPATAKGGVDAFGNPARDEPSAGQAGAGSRDAS
jgi:sec-independent protein translocase protein TatA